MNLSNSNRRDAGKSPSREVHVSAVTIPIIREPSFKSELRIPVVSVRKDKRPVTPTLRPDEIGSSSDLTTRRPPTGAGQKSFMGRLGKRLSRDNIRLDMRRSSESLPQRSEDTMSLKSFKEGALSPFVNMSPIWLRKKFVERQDSQRRQIMCKDLGGSDCEGWLWKKHEGTGHKSKWSIRWFKLDRKKLCYYKHEDDKEPIGVIHLPGLKISPAPEVKSKKYAFKAHHSGTTFLFAAESREDMVKWMNKMGLASLEALDLNRSCTTAGFLQVESPFFLDADISDSNNSRSDSDNDSVDSLGSCRSSRPNSGRSSYAGSREDIVDFYNKLHDANMAPDGSNIKEKRSTAFFTTVGRTQDEQRVYPRLLALRRTLQDKEDQLKTICSFLETNPIRSADIESFMKANAHIFHETEEKAKLENNRSTNDSSLEDSYNPSKSELSVKCEGSNLLVSPKLSSDR